MKMKIILLKNELEPPNLNPTGGAAATTGNSLFEYF